MTWTKKYGRIWHQMCLCGPSVPPALATFISSDQNVAPKQRDSRHKIWLKNNVIRDIIWQQSPKTMHKSVRNTKTGQFWLCFLKYPQFWSSKNVMDQKNGRIWHQMCLCGPIAPPALVTFMTSDQNVAPEVSLWLQAGLHVLQLLWGLGLFW